MSLRPGIRAIIFDLDNTLYRKPLDNNDIFAKAAAQSALNLGFRATYAEALKLAESSGEKYRSENAVFWREHGLDQRELFRESHRIGVEMMCQSVAPDEKLCKAFNRLAAQVEDILILSHASQEWVEKMAGHLTYATRLRPERIYGLDHPLIDYRTKDAGTEAYAAAASIMGVPTDKIAVVEDTTANLLPAHVLDMQAIHVHWGRRLRKPPAHVHSQVRSISSIRR